MNHDGYIQQLEEKIQILQTLNEKLLQENEDLKNRLHYYENPHTPPSENTLKKQEKESLQPDPLPKKRGAPNGHKGATRPKKQHEEFKDVINQKCEKCGSENIQKQEKSVEKVIEDLQPPPKPKIILYKLWEVKCLDCGHQSLSKDRDCPQKGNFGIFLIVYITMLKFHLRGVSGNYINENLYYAFGITDKNRLLFIVFIFKRNNEALIISARDMDYKEKSIYSKL